MFEIENKCHLIGQKITTQFRIIRKSLIDLLVCSNLTYIYIPKYTLNLYRKQKIMYHIRN